MPGAEPLPSSLGTTTAGPPAPRQRPCAAKLTGDLAIRWTRRSRALAADSRGSVEVPLAEGVRGPGPRWGHESPSNEAYEVELGKPLIVRSAYRSPEHNRAVGGATRSKHLDGAAFDIAMANHDPVAFEAAAREVGFLGFGFYPRSGFIHVDLGPARQWGERFPVRATAFAEETPPAREVLADSRT